MTKIDYKKINFISEIYPDILERLKQNEVYYTKSSNRPNWVNVAGNQVYVRTEKSSPDFLEIPFDFFLTTWKLLVENGKISQTELSKNYNIKRSAFMLIAFDLLDIVTYLQDKNALRLEDN